MAIINKKELSELFIEIKKDNKEAFEKLYTLYSKLVYSIAFSIVKNKQDTEDIVQIVFTKIYSIDKSKLPYKNEASWIYSITKNESINFLRKRDNNVSLDDTYEIEDDNNEITKIIDKNSYNKLISSLGDKEKEIISLKLLANLSFDEIGKLLKIPTGTVKWRYYKSINTLKILLSNLGIFIVTAILSTAILKNSKKAVLPDKSENNTSSGENNREESTPEKLPEEETKKEENIIESDSSQTNENIIENDSSQSQENIIEVPNVMNNPNYVGMGFMGVSSIFLIATIIFSIIFTKHQLKRRKKLSK